MITIINYGLGNIQAIVNIYKRLNIPVVVVSTAHEVANAEKIVLPGVGAFDWAMSLLNDSGMRSCLNEVVTVKKIPIMGICVGMQMLARSSDEGKLKGLGWIDAEVKKFDDSKIIQKTHLPHMGWNDVIPKSTGSLFRNIEVKPRYYFLHSYYFLPQREEDVLAVTDYNGTFASAVCSDNVYGVQFHPEKSHQWGIQLLKNFAEL